MLFNHEQHAIANRAKGPYWWAYWVMLFGTIILPLTLLLKKLGNNPFYLLLVAFMIKSGRYFERFVIIVTSLHRDYLLDGNNNLLSYFEYLIAYFFFGFLLALFLLGIIYLKDRIKHEKSIN